VRETFASLFGAEALNFGRAAGSFAVSAGVVDVDTVSLAAGATTVLADARLDLNTLSLSSGWTIRAAEPAAAGQVQPYVGIRFSGPIVKPERQVDLVPLLDLLRTRYLQHQLDELDQLEAARRQAEERRLRWEREHPASSPPAAGAATPAVPPPGEPAAPNADMAPPADAPSMGLGEQPGAVSPLGLAPPPDEASVPAIGFPGQIAPDFQGMVTGDVGTPAATGLDGAPSGGAPAVDPPADASAPPADATAPPEDAAAPPADAAAPPADAAPPPAAVARAPARPAKPPPDPAPQADVYKTLPNGVIIKVR
jgi:hypothetical protein